MQKLEETGSLLLTTFTTYLKYCSNLETTYSQDDGKSTDLISRIDSTLTSVHATLGQQLGQCNSILARTRNGIVSPPCRLPTKILAEIFLNVIFVPTNEERRAHLEMESTVQTIYRRLHLLNRICHVRRNVVVNCKSAWRVTPFIDMYTQGWCLTPNLSLQRGDDRLHLASIHAHTTDSLNSSDILAKHAHRFSSANIQAESLTGLKNILTIFLKSRHPLTLTELSICQTLKRNQVDDDEHNSFILEASDYMFHEHSSLQLQFNKILESLSILCISGASIDWDTITFSTCLTELHLHGITLRSNFKLLDFLQAASSASELRNLKTISVLSMTIGTLPTSYPALSFPKLQTLFLEDLDFNDLKVVLCVIPIGPRQLTLSLGKSCFIFHEDEDTRHYVRSRDLYGLLERSVVHTMILKKVWDLGFGFFEVRSLLNSVPGLKTLVFLDCALGVGGWNAMIQPEIEAPVPFPKLEELYLSRVELYNLDGIKRVVESHSMRKVVIGGYVRDKTKTKMGRYLDQELEDTRPDIIKWLRQSVPEVCIDSSGCVLSEFKQSGWRLW